jgi:hypothetical protein
VINQSLSLDVSYDARRYPAAAVTTLLEHITRNLTSVVDQGLDRRATVAALPARETGERKIDGLESQPSIVETYPLSPVQEGMLLHAIAHPHSAVSVQSVSVNVVGPLCQEALQHTWDALVSCHAALRTVFEWCRQPQPVQLVLERSANVLSVIDLRGLDGERARAEIRRLVGRDRTRGFDIRNGPLHRLYVFHLADDGCTLLWSYHHLLLDGWSVSLLADSFFEQYRSIREGLPVRERTSNVQRDFIAWSRRQDVDAARRFWRRELRSFRPTRSLALASEAHTVHEPDVDQRALSLAPELSRSVAVLVRDQQISKSTLVHAAWALVLGAITKVSDVIFASVASGRAAEIPGIDRALGMFIRLVPCRMRLRESLSISSMLANVSRQAQGRQHHGHVSLADIYSWTGFSYQQRVVESVVIFQNYPSFASDGSAVADFSLREIEVHEQSVFPLTLMVFDAEPLSFRLQFDRRRVAEAVPALLLQLFTRALHTISVAPESTVGHVLSALRDSLPQVELARNVNACEEDVSGGKATRLAEETCEAQIAQVWRRVLGLTHIDENRTFFELGGNSVSVLLAQRALEAKTGLTLPSTLLFRYPTVKALARHLRGEAGGALGQGAERRALEQRQAAVARTALWQARVREKGEP